MKPVATFADCFDWLTIEEVQAEVLAAFQGARRHALEYDFAADAREIGVPLQPGAVLDDDGNPWWGRMQFIEYMAAGIVWRLKALAKRKGVDVSDFDVAGYLSAPVFAEHGFAAPYFSFLGDGVTP